jgi:glutaredoxin
MKTIAVFTLNGCVYCAQLKQKLSDLSIPFHDIEITKNKDLWDKIVAQTGYDVLPTVYIQEDDIGNGLVYTPGRDFQSNDEIIEIIKRNI